LAHYFAELGERFEEPFDPRRTLPADAADMVPPAGVFLIARFGFNDDPYANHWFEKRLTP